MEQRVQYLCKLRRPGKHANGVFHKEIEHFHFSQRKKMLEFLKFQGKLLFSDFCSRMISFFQPLCPASACFEFTRVA